MYGCAQTRGQAVRPGGVGAFADRPCQGALLKRRMNPTPAGVEHRGRYLRVDCRRADTRIWIERCRALADVALARDASRVLVDATDCDAEGEHSLRDALTTLVLAEIAGGLRLALVTNVPAVRASFVTLERDLRVLDMHVKLFGDERQAEEWLLARAAREPTDAAFRPRASDAP